MDIFQLSVCNVVLSSLSVTTFWAHSSAANMAAIPTAIPSVIAHSTANTQSLQHLPQHLIAQQSGPISEISTFGVLPQYGDTLDAGHYTITIDQSFSAGLINSPTGTLALKGEFVVEAGITLTVNGDWDASQINTQNLLKAGASIEFDGDSGIKRSYKAVSQHYQAPSLMVQSNADNKAFFGLKPGAAGTFVYNKQGYLGANISGGNVHLNGFSSGYIHDGYDVVTTRDCNMPNTLFTNSGQFELRYYAGEQGSCNMENLTILSPTVTTAFRTIGSSNSTAKGPAYNLNGLSVDGEVAYYTRSEFLMNDWVVRDLAATLPQSGWANVDSWLLFNVDTIPVGSALTSNIYFRAEKANPHGFTLAGDGLAGFSSRKLDSVIFDFNNLDIGETGDMYMFDGRAVTDEVIHISNNIALKNLNGKQSNTFLTFNNGDQSGRKVELQNNVVFIPLTNTAIATNEASLTPSFTLSKMKDNIFWGQADQKGYVVDSLDDNSFIDILQPEAYSHNGLFNARVDGQHHEFNLPLSFTPVSAVTTDSPYFYDDQRRLETYGSTVLGLDGSAESAFNAHLTRHLSAKDMEQLSLMPGSENYVTTHRGKLVIKALVDWVKQGFIATTTTYHNSSSTAGPVGLTATPTFTLADSDNDTIDDRFDQCNNTGDGVKIDEFGCAADQHDSDGDNVSDVLDICIATASNVSVNEQGCSESEVNGNIAGFSSWGVGGGGAMASYSINPFDHNMRFVGTDMGTAFRSLNAGTQWVPIRHSQLTYSYKLGYSVPFGFAGPTTILHSPEGLAPLRSINGGETFNPVASFDLSKDERITGWYSDTVTIGTIYAMTTAGLWHSNDAGNHWRFIYDGGSEIKGMFIDNHDNGRVYIATTNAIYSANDGVNFTRYFRPKKHKIHRFSGGSNPSGKTLIYASDESALAIRTALQQGLQSGDVTASYNKPSDAGVEVSAGMIYINKKGNRFSRTNQFVGSHLMMAQNDPNTIYATGSRSWGRDKGTSIYVSEDAGSSWQLRLLQYDWDTSPFSPWSNTKLEHSPVGLNIGWYDAGYYTVGINQLNSAQFGASGNFFLHNSENTANDWQDLTNNYQGTAPLNPAKTDLWTTSGLNVTSVYDIKYNPANNSDIYAAYADVHGARSTDNGQTWQLLANTVNSIYDYAFDPADANTVFMVNGSQHDWPFRDLSFVGNGGVFKSSNKGDSWQRLTPDNGDYNRQYLSIGYDATRRHIYAGSQSDGISRSLDGGVSWEKFNLGLPGTLPGHDYGMDLVIPQIEVLANGNVYALVTGARPELTAAQVNEFGIAQNALIIDNSGATTQYYSWVNSAYTGIYLLDVANGATSWRLLRGDIHLDSHESWDSNHQPWKRPMSFAVDHNNSNTLWLTDMEPRTAQVGATGVWKSQDNGQNWHFILQHTVALDIDIAPNDSNLIAVAGPIFWQNGGIFISKDSGKNWLLDERAPLQNNAHSVCFDPRDNSKIVYGYFGGGMLYGDRL